MDILYICNFIKHSKYLIESEDNIYFEEFKCFGFCIDKKLKCSQIINCRENSDESELEAGCEG